MNEDYIFELPIKVRDYEVDAEGIVNNANYLHYLEHTRHEFCESAGLSFRQMHAEGLDPVVSRIEMRYIRPLGLGDSMISRLALRRRGPLFIFNQDIFTPDGNPVVRATVEIASFENGRLSRGDRLAAAFSKFLKSLPTPPTVWRRGLLLPPIAISLSEPHENSPLSTSGPTNFSTSIRPHSRL